MHPAAAATSYLLAGLSVIPIKADGSKAPAVQTWTPYRNRQATPAEVATWYGVGPVGVAILGGAISGGLEVLDFDEPEAWDRWRMLALGLLKEAGDTLPRLPVVRTPTNGRHLFYRHTGEQVGNTKLATRRVDGRLETVIETRGSGGYVLAPGCSPACHPSGRTYDLLQGDLLNVPTIGLEARAILLDAARSLSEVPAAEPHEGPRIPAAGSSNRPGDLYNQRARWDDLLRRHGWRPVRRQGTTTYWCRPGKRYGISASTGHAQNYLYVWSSNAPPFEPERAYSLFGAYTLLEHGGDFVAASAALVLAGYVAEPQALTVRYGTGREATNQLTRVRAS